MYSNMKNLFTILAIVFITSLSWAQSLKLSIDNINSSEINLGDTISVNLHIDKYPQTISSFQMYILFDQSVLKYVETKDVNKLFKATWRDNLTVNFFVGLFLDFTKKGFVVENDEDICELVFVYQGGETDLVWCTEDETKEGIKIKGKTKFLNSKNEHIVLELVDGCVCKQ